MDYDRRRFLTAGSALVCSSLFAPALGADSTLPVHSQLAASAQSIGRGKRLRLLLPEGSQGNVQPVADLFSRLTDVEIELQTVPVDSIVTNMLLARGAGEVNYDIALPATFGVPELVESGTLQPLDEFRRRHEPAIIPEGALYTQGDRYDSRFYGYQTDGDVYLMFYNQQFLAAADQARYEDATGEAFTLPRTWEELDAQVHFFHAPESGRYGGLLFRTPDYLVWEFWLRLHAKGVLPLANDLSSNLVSDAAVRSLEEMIEVTPALHPSCFSNGLVDNWETYAEGDIYANIGWGGSQKHFNKPASKVRGKLLNTPTPGLKDKDSLVPVSYFNWGWNYTVPVESAHPELAYLFMAFAVSPLPSTVAVSDIDGFFDPFRIEHYQNPQIIASYGDEFLRAHREAMRHCIPDFYVQGQYRYFAELRKYLSGAIDGKLSARTALLAADRGWQAITDTLGEEKLARQWQQLKANYPTQYLRHVA